MSAAWLIAVLVGTGVVGVATLISSVGAASFVLTTGPIAYRIAISVLLCITLFFEVGMLSFGALGLLADATQVITVLTLAFGAVGTLAGTYFGIQARSDTSHITQTSIKRASSITNRAVGESNSEKSRSFARDSSRTTG